jgi:hypothetical protein
LPIPHARTHTHHTHARTQETAPSEETYQQEVLGVSLALAILSAACRQPAAACTEDMVARVPALVRVVKAGGLIDLIARPAVATADRPPGAAVAVGHFGGLCSGAVPLWLGVFLGLVLHKVKGKAPPDVLCFRRRPQVVQRRTTAAVAVAA